MASMEDEEAQAPVDVTQILNAKFKSATVDKDDDLKYDLYNLAATDIHPIDVVQFRADKEEYLEALGRDNAQLLFTHIFQLPTHASKDGIMAALPKPLKNLPRSKPLPQPKPETRWEKYAKLKGIKKKKEDRLIWDEVQQKFLPRWRTAKNKETQWAIEHKEGDDPNVDPFLKIQQEKKANVEKNKKNMDRNLKRKESTELPGGVDAPKLGIGAKKAKLISDLGNTLDLASLSTASVGKFNRRLPGEKGPAERKGIRKVSGLTDKHDIAAEKANYNKLMDKMFDKQAAKTPVDISAAAGKVVQKKQRTTQETNRAEILDKVHKKQKKRK